MKGIRKCLVVAGKFHAFFEGGKYFKISYEDNPDFTLGLTVYLVCAVSFFALIFRLMNEARAHSLR